MNTELRELFESGADVVTAPDLVERAVRGARSRRRNRVVVGAAVLATTAVVLGVLVGTGQLRTDTEPRPADVAAIPAELPRALGDAVPNLEAGMLETASAAYVSDGVVAFVDASTGDVVRRTFGPPPLDGEGQLSVLVPVLDVALSPDGRTAAVIVEKWGREIPGQTLRLLDLASDRETLVLDLMPADDRGADSASRPSVVAWENDSQHLVCSCAVGGEVPQLVRVSAEGSWERMASDISPIQVSAGSAGVVAQLEADGGPWLMAPEFTPDDPAVPASYAAALSRGSDQTYIALRGSGFTIGHVDGSSTPIDDVLVEPPGVHDFVTAIGVGAAQDGYVVATAAGNYVDADRRDGSDGGEEAQIQAGQLVFVGDAGEQRVISTLPAGTRSASVASDLVGAPDPAPLGTLPQTLPSPDGLPFLSDGDVEVASAAYITDGALVVVDAAGGKSYVVDALAADLERSETDGATMFHPDSSLSMSPDGRYLVVTHGVKTDGATGLMLFDVARPQFRPLPVDLAFVGQTPVPPTRMAWSWDSGDFYCVCSAPGEITQLHRLDVAGLQDGTDATVTRIGVQPSQLAAGPVALLGRFDGSPTRWEPIDAGESERQEPPGYGLMQRHEAADVLLLGPDSASFVTYWNGGTVKVHARGSSGTWPTNRRWLTGVWGVKGPIAVTYTGEAASGPLAVSYLEANGDAPSGGGEHLISTLPPGTTAAGLSAVVVP